MRIGFANNLFNLLSLSFIFSTFFYSSFSVAELPLTIEDLISEKGSVRLNASFSYATSNTKSLQTSDPIIVQTGETSFITVPTKVGEIRSNIDTIVSTLGLRYGLSNNAELYSRASYVNNETRYSSVSGTGEESLNQLASAWAGLNYQLSRDDQTPALLAFMEGALYENHREDSASGKSWLIGITTYRAIDPIVIALTATYQWNQKRDDGNLSYKPGDFILISPSVAFTVNERVTLTSGFQWISRQSEKYDNVSGGFRQTNMDIVFGMGYGFAEGNTVNISFDANVSGQDQSSLRVNWLYAF